MEIGGYLGYEKYNGKMLHHKAIKLNLARNCLKYILVAKHVKKLFLPYYICDSVINICHEVNVQIEFYDIDKKFFPILTNIKGQTVYVVNYFGFLDNRYIKKLMKDNRLIVDNVQAYFQPPVHGVDTIYSCRKFLGVSDGAFLYTNQRLKMDLEVDSSANRILYLAGRLEFNAERFFTKYRENETNFKNVPLKKMSKFTENILCSLNYARIKKIRTKNYQYLFTYLKDINLIDCRKIKGSYCYPLMLSDAKEIREKLILKKIYIPVLWPNCLSLEKNNIGYEFASKILAIPCDQRYTRHDMEKIVNYIKEMHI